MSNVKLVFKILMLVKLFGLVSGTKLNKQKIFGMWLGQWRGHSGQPAGLHWTSKGRVEICHFEDVAQF